MNFLSKHLDVFRQSRPARWSSRMKLGSWIEHTEYKFETPIAPALLDRFLSRADLVGLRNGTAGTMPAKDLCAVIFAWGGMKPHHGKRFFKDADRAWITIATQLSNGNIGPIDAYDRFFKLSISGKLPGARPAYYTKLLYFLPPDHLERGLIMDQWTSRSVNLITGQAVVKLESRSFLVKKENSASVYALYCDLVRKLSLEIHGDSSPLSIEDTELRLFSEGGRTKAMWRQYVLDNVVETARG